MIFFNHWSDVPADIWRWKNFSSEEIACRGTGKVGVDFDAMDKLQALRDLLGVPLILNSAYRSPEHNKAVGGAKASQHLKAKAFDVSMTNQNPADFEAAARAVGFTGFGFYKRNNFIHIDTGPARQWGARWFATKPAPDLPASRFSPPPARLPETIGRDTGVKGLALGGAGTSAVVATVGGAVSDLSPTAQVVLIVGGLVLVVGMFVIARDKLRQWL